MTLESRASTAAWPPVRLPVLAVAAAVGVAVSGATAWAASWAPWALLAVVAALAWPVPARGRWLLVAALIAAALAGHERAPVAAPGGVTVDDRDLDRLVGWVTGPVTPSRWGATFVLDTGDARVLIGGAATAVLPGDRVAVTGRVMAPRGYRDPGAPDRRQIVRAQGADWELRARTVELLAADDRASAWRAPVRAARTASAAVAARGGDPDGNALVRGAVLGDRSALDDDLEAAWRAAGVYHALSVSGLHLAVVALLAFVAVGRAWALVGLGALVAPRRAAAAVALPLAIAYTLVTGAQVATVRALLVVAVMLIGELCGRRARAADALGLAALAVLAHRPSTLWDPGFQLSFVAAATLIVAAARGDQPVDELRPPWPRRAARGLARMIATSGAVALATAPITAAHFHEVSLGGVAGNLVATPLIELAAIPLGLAGAVLAVIAPAVGGPVIDLAVMVAGATAWLVAALAAWTPSVSVPPPNAVELAACAGVWAAWALARTGRLPGRGRAALALAAASVVVLCGSWAWHAHVRTADDRLRVTFLDVGQGDAAVIELPDGAVWLVDAGGAPGAAGDDAAALRAAARPGEIVARFLRTRRIARVDVAVISHPHPDHYLGLLALAGAVPIGELWMAADDAAEAGAMAPVLAWLEAAGTRVVHPRLGATALGDVTVRVLAPVYDPGDGARPVATADPVRSVNDDSLVIAVERAGRRVLFTGDIEDEGEAELTGRGGAGLASDVVKVPHHGSPTSSTAALVAATRPALAVVSLGRGNRFGFPGPAVVARWQAAGTRILRTDEVGAITVTVDRAGRLEVATFDRARP